MTLADGATYTEFVIGDVVPIEVASGEGRVRVAQDDPRKVKCTLTDFGEGYYPVFIVTLGDRDDTLDGQGIAGQFYGGASNDTLTGGTSPYGEDGDDTLGAMYYASGGYGHDTIEGTDNANHSEAGTGHGIVLAGDGKDTVYGRSRSRTRWTGSVWTGAS